MSSKTLVLDIESSEFDSLVIENTKPVLLKFYSDTCAPCKVMAPIVDQLAEQFDGRVAMYQCNSVNNRELVEECGVRQVPTIVIFDKGELLSRRSGIVPRAEIETVLSELVKK